jgi:two-component system, cell cycle sensor histidine kinase and response regulator CckA
VRLWVADTGHGIKPDVMPRIFEPFFTTKENGTGSGLGLSTVYGIVKQSGGCVTVSTGAGRGTAFGIYLPRAIEPLEAPAPQPESKGSVRGSETILLVEDERVVRSLARDVLEDSGYHILCIPDGTSALKIALEYPHPIDLLIADVVMPEVSGPELAARLRNLLPHTRVLYMSGYSNDETLCRKGVPEDSAFLQKPFTPEQLIHKVRDTLDARPHHPQ